MTTTNHLDCTTDHPVFVAGKGYVAADLIQPGDLLITPTGTKRVKAIENLPAPDFVYNLSTFPNQNYFANNVLVHNCDDPIDPKRAVSEAELKTAADFVTNILPSRKVDKAVAVTTLVMQRLHELDPSGVLLAKSKEMEGLGRIRHVCLPARLADNVKPIELREKYTDNLMDPVRLPEIVLREQEMLLGAYSFSGQYLQSPVPLSGGMFKIDAFNTRVKAAPYDCNRILYVDRACLTAGTLITTAAGPKAIENIQIGDTVLTRQGFKKVKWAGETKKVSELVWVAFANGSVVMGTPEHRIWTENRGWIELASIRSSDYNLQLTDWRDSWFDVDASGNPIRKSFNSTTSPTPDGPANDTSSPTVGTRNASGTGPTPYTGPSGGSITATFPVTMMFTTETATGPITRLKILNACPARNTTGNTIPSPPGTRPRRLASSGSGMFARLGEMLRIVLTSAFSVGKSLLHDVLTYRQNFVQPSVASVTGSVKNQNSVSYATRSFGGGPDPRAVPPSVVPSFGPSSVPSATSLSAENNWYNSFAPNPAGLSGSIPVYDLEVEDAHEFFANGVLVHNSTQDGGCYTAMVLMARSQDGNSWFIEHCVHGQWEPDERNRRTLAEALRCRVRYGPSHEPHIYIEAEGGSSGRDAFKGVARALAGFVVREHRPTGKKQVRAEPLASQWAAGNIALVDDGTWDINNYIQEHVHFPLGKYMDQVDASSGAFALLVQQRPTGGLRSYSLSHKKKQALRILICTPEQLANLSTTSRCLLIYLSDPQVEEMELALPPEKPSPHGLPNILDTLHLHFLAASPADYQEHWLEPVPGYDVLPEKLLLSKEQVKKLWQRITLHRDPWIESILLVDEDTNRSTSISLAVCDGLQLGRDLTLGWVGKEDWHAKRDDKPVHQYLFDQVRLGRNLVV